MQKHSLLFRLSALAALLALTLVGLHEGGCAQVVMTAHALKTKLTRADPDYEELDAHLARARAGTPADQGSVDAKVYPPSVWTAYRGSLGDGVYREQALLETWPEGGPECLWRQPVGGGYASFAISSGCAVTIEQRRDDEAVVAYDLETGVERWSHRDAARFSEDLGGEGPRATPAIAEQGAERWVVALGATGNLNCLALGDGALRWHRNVLGNGSDGNLTYGLSASPIVVGELVIVVTGAEGSPQLVHGFSLETGEPVWTALSDGGTYTTPMHVQLAGRTMLIVVTHDRVVGLDPNDGAQLWETPWSVMGGLSVSQPLVVGDDRLFLSGGYGKGSMMLSIKAQEGGGFEVEPIWRNTRLKAKFNSPVVHAGYLYGLDEGTLVCLDQETGSREWKGGRFGYGQMLLTGERLIVLSESGELALVAASPDGYEELCRFDAIQGTSWNVPALSNGRMLVRNAREMACFDLSRP